MASNTMDGIFNGPIKENSTNMLDNYTYYSRLTLVHPKDINKLDPTLGRILCETGATGRFILADITLDSAAAPNSDTSVAYGTTGEMKIYEPLGTRFIDYIRFAALEVGLANHLDAKFLLEIEIISNGHMNKNDKFRFIWPIMIMSNQVKGSSSEKGTEYNIKFITTGVHSQTDMVQPIKETMTVKGVSNIKDYFTGFGRLLEVIEYEYAAAGQKATSSVPPPENAPGGNHPASADPYHDEYHFILDPRIENYRLENNGAAGKDVTASWVLSNIWNWNNRKYDVAARGGTTVISQIQRVLSSTKEAGQLYLESFNSPTSSQSSVPNSETLKSALGKIYNFFRIDTHTVYKEFDHVRGRYAVKHIFMIYLALEPTLYQYPDEIDVLNRPENKDKVITKLKAYVQEGLLQKSYNYQYTGLNTDILKFNIEFNNMYFLPSFPVVWTTLGESGAGQIEPHNFSRQETTYTRYDPDLNSKVAIAKAEIELKNLGSRIATEKNQAKRLVLQTELTKKKAALDERRTALSASGESTTTINGVKNRSEYLSSLNNLYIEDVDYEPALTAVSQVTPALRPRVEPDVPPSMLDKEKSQDQITLEKIFTVQLGARDLVEIELDIKGDPYWMGSPSMGLSGKNLDKLGLPPAMKSKVSSDMPSIDPDFSSKPDNSWNNYGSATFYKGGVLFYLNSQLPTSDSFVDDLMNFGDSDQIVGIYRVKFVTNKFKDGMWVQTLKATRDLTIPSQFLPRASKGEGFEAWAAAAGNEKERAYSTMQRSIAAERERNKSKQEQTNTGYDNDLNSDDPVVGGA